MASDLFVGGRIDSVVISAGAPTESTDGASFSSTYADASLTLTSSDEVTATFLDASLAATSVTSGQSVWTHFEEYFSNQNVSAGTLIWAWYDTSGFPWVAARAISTNTFGIYYNSGTGASPVWTQLGANITFAFVRYAFDVVISLGSPHSITVYRDGSALSGVGGTFTQASLTNLGVLKFKGHHSGASAHYSQIYITEGRPTVGAKVDYNRASGAASANTGWGGTHTNINEAINSDVTVDSTTTAGLRQTYPVGDVTVPAGYVISSVWHWLRAKNNGSAPQNIKSSARIGSTNYDYAANAPGIGVGFGPLPARYDTSPATGVGWAQAEFNGAEFGYLSVT